MLQSLSVATMALELKRVVETNSIQSTFYTYETNLWTNTKMLNVKMSPVVVMHDEVKACKQFIIVLLVL